MEPSHIPSEESGQAQFTMQDGGPEAFATPQVVDRYPELKRLIKKQGLLEKQPLYYSAKIAVTLGFLVLSLAMLVSIHLYWFQLLNAIFLAFASTQIALLAHDAGHRQIAHKIWKNNVIILIAANLCIGMSGGWWIDKHNRHHSHPNQQDLDPDIDIPIIAFTEEDIRRKNRFVLYIIKYQAYLFFPLMALVSFDFQQQGLRFVLNRKGKYSSIELLLIIIHLYCYATVLLWQLGIWRALLFTLIYRVFLGFYMGMIFSPNHKGMPILDANNQMSFLDRQLLTARNITSHPLIDFLYGGLNFQIEHHLFPTIPRNRLKETQKLIKSFCQIHALPYHETTLAQSYLEILRYLHQISMPLRLKASTQRPKSLCGRIGGKRQRKEERINARTPTSRAEIERD